MSPMNATTNESWFLSNTPFINYMYTKGGLVNPKGMIERIQNSLGTYGCPFLVQLLLALFEDDIPIDDYQYSRMLKLV